ncbi:hypothetical protein T484DRAFT_1752514 [Baffinella frigidus]|nr:hypothetical protein T484DRAFT_1752514 [Cryptophyta sp. CCMP2293]
MAGHQGALPPQHGAAIRRAFAFRSPSVQPSASSLQSAPQVRKPSLPLRASSLKSSTAAISHEGTRAGRRLSLPVDAKVGSRFAWFAAKTSVHPVLATRYKWRAACAKALQMDRPDEHFLSAMQHRGIALPAPIKTDAVRRPSTEATSLPSSTASTSRRGSTTHLHAPRAPRFARAASVIDASPHPPDFAPAAVATRRRSYDQDTRLCISYRTERNTLMRLSPRFGTEQAAMPQLPEPSRLPGPLRCAKKYAPRVRSASTSLA